LQKQKITNLQVKQKKSGKESKEVVEDISADAIQKDTEDK